MMGSAEPSALSLLPALITIGLAIATRQVIAALALGVATGSLVVLLQTGDTAAANPITAFLFPSLGSKGYAQILLIYLWSLGGLIGLWERTGGARHFAETVGAALARGPRSSLVLAWLLGVIFHQGGTVSTVLTGSTVKPVADRHRISHEELAYVVDSTSSPIATILAFNAWPLYVAGLVAGTIALLPDEEAGFRFFWDSIWFNFYGWFAVIGTLLFALRLLPWVGASMEAARRRATVRGELDRPGAEPLLPPAMGNGSDGVADGYTPSLIDFFVPLSVLLGLAVIPMVAFDASWVNEAFLCSVLSAMLVAAVRGMPLRDILDGFVGGCQKMTIGAIVLGLAVTLGTVSKELGTAAYLVAAIGDGIPPVALPAILTFLCMAIAFATGTSWGTYAVVFPLAMPLAWALLPDPTFVKICFGAVLGGSVFGDQCSPISDTTILSSMFTGCDLVDHVRTQIPLALTAALLGIGASTLCAAFVG